MTNPLSLETALHSTLEQWARSSVFIDAQVDEFNWKALSSGDEFSAENPLRIRIGDSNAPLCKPGWFTSNGNQHSQAMTIQMLQLAPKLWELILAPSPNTLQHPAGPKDTEGAQGDKASARVRIALFYRNEQNERNDRRDNALDKFTGKVAKTSDDDQTLLALQKCLREDPHRLLLCAGNPPRIRAPFYRLILVGSNQLHLPLLSKLPLTELHLLNCLDLIEAPIAKTLQDFSVSNCRYITDLSALAEARRLQRISIHWCRSITHLPRWPQSMTQLRIQWCPKLEYIPELNLCSQLRILHIDGCNRLRFFPQLNGLSHLQLLSICWYNGSAQIPEIDQLLALKTLLIQSIDQMQHLPSISGLQNLRCISLQDNPNLRMIELPFLPVLSQFSASGCSQLRLLSCGQAPSLKHIQLSRCAELSELNGLGSLSQLRAFTLSSNDCLISLADLRSTSLSTLQLQDCAALTSLPLPITTLSSMQVYGCKEIQNLDGLEQCTELTALQLGGCSKVSQIPELELPKLKTLTLSWFQNLDSFPNLSSLSSLESLKLSGQSSINDIQGLGDLRKLKVLDLSRCNALKSIDDIHTLKELTHLSLRGCRSIKAVDGLNKLSKLTHLNISHCSSLYEISAIGLLPALEHLDLSYCRNIHRLPRIRSERLSHLNIAGRHQHTDLSKLQHLSSLEFINLEDVSKISNFASLAQAQNLREIIGPPADLCAQYLAGSAVLRQDISYIQLHLDRWMEQLNLTNNIRSLVAVLSQALLVAKVSEQKWLKLIRLLRQIERRMLGDSTISEQTWEHVFTTYLRSGNSALTPAVEILGRSIRFARIDWEAEENLLRGMLGVFFNQLNDDKCTALKELLQKAFISATMLQKARYQDVIVHWTGSTLEEHELDERL